MFNLYFTFRNINRGILRDGGKLQITPVHSQYIVYLELQNLFRSIVMIPHALQKRMRIIKNYILEYFSASFQCFADQTVNDIY